MKKIAFAGLTLALLGVSAYMWLSPHQMSVVRISSANPKLQQAVLEAQKGLPDFWSKVAAASEDRQRDFAVRVQFKTDQGPEYLWVRGPLVRKDMVSGTLDQSPMVYARAHKGDIVRFSEGEIVDWMIRNPDGTQSGGATDAALGN